MSGRAARAGQRGELLLELSPDAAEPVRQQLRRRLLDAIASGRLVAGDRLPPSRELAADLRVGRGTVVDVYSQLSDEGYLAARPGAGTVVAVTHPEATAAVRSTTHTWVPAVPPDVHVLDLRPGAPDLASFPRSAWAAATSHSLRTVRDADLGYVHPWGVGVLRAQLAGHLARTRGTVADPDHVVVTTGVTQALTLTCRLLADLGLDRLAVEDPSNAVQRRVLRRHISEICNIPVDDEGLDVESLSRSGVRAVLVTPAHQHPTGVVLSQRRRAELLDWAARVDGLIIEDDYDAEFQYAKQGHPSLQGIAPHHVVHMGSVSKTLAPGVRLGWFLAPPQLRAALMGNKRDDDFGTSVLTQHVLARLLETGAYDRHLRGQRLRYRARRRALVDQLERQLPGWRVTGAEAGLQLCVLPSHRLDEEAVVAAAARAGLLLLELGRLRVRPGPCGFVLGFARLAEREAASAVARLRHAVAVSRANGRGSSERRSARPLSAAEPQGTTSLDYFPPGSEVEEATIVRPRMVGPGA